MTVTPTMLAQVGLQQWPNRRELLLTGDLSHPLEAPHALGKVLREAQLSMPRSVIEQVWLAAFTMKGDLLGTFLVGEGSTLAVAIYTRRIVQAALKCNASALLLLHNHLAPDHHPSREDVEATWQLQSSLAPLELELIDHIVVAETGQMTSILGKIDPEQIMRASLAMDAPAAMETKVTDGI